MLFLAPACFAMEVSVEARLDSVAMLIGCQNRLYVDVYVPQHAQVSIPDFPGDTVVGGVLILERSETDSSDIKNGRTRFSRQWLLTSFDEGLYYLPPVKVQIDGGEYQSNDLSLKIATYDVDTVSMQIFDIKPVEKAPFVLDDYLNPIRYGWGILAVILLAFFLFRTFHGQKEEESLPEPELLLPPHIAALQALDVIREEKIWTQGRYKDFYTQLTDVIRKYISRRFGLSAMEMTSAEILEVLKHDGETQDVYANLKQILELSDFVKFAKMNPMPLENDRSVRDAYLFVESTKETVEAAGEDTEENPEEKKGETI